MNSRERVERALRFARPDRIPVSLPPPFPNDILECWPARPPLDTSKGPVRDEWGSLWASVSPGAIGEVVEPAIIDWDRCPHFRIPPVNDPERYASAARPIADDRGEHYAVGVIPVSLFARVHHIRGLDNVLADFYLNPDRLAGLVDTSGYDAGLHRGLPHLVMLRPHSYHFVGQLYEQVLVVGSLSRLQGSHNNGRLQLGS